MYKYIVTFDANNTTDSSAVVVAPAGMLKDINDMTDDEK